MGNTDQAMINMKATADSYREQLAHADAALREADAQNTILKAKVQGLEAVLKAMRVARARERRLITLIERIAERR